LASKIGKVKAENDQSSLETHRENKNRETHKNRPWREAQTRIAQQTIWIYISLHWPDRYYQIILEKGDIKR